MLKEPNQGPLSELVEKCRWWAYFGHVGRYPESRRGKVATEAKIPGRAKTWRSQVLQTLRGVGGFKWSLLHGATAVL